jgi:nucleoside-diphosphate-sugar epimerase
MQKVLLTGASGTVSKYLLPYLNGFGFQVEGLSRRELNDSSDMIVHVYSENDQDSLVDLMSDFSTVVHTAALTRSADPRVLFESNQKLTKQMVDAAVSAGVRRFIFLSSDLALNPVGAYGQSKLECEEILRQSELVDWVVIRLSPFIGGVSDKDNSTFSQFIQAVEQDKRIWLPDGGDFIVAPVCAKDLASVLSCMISDKSDIKKVYTLSGEQYTLRHFLNTVAKDARKSVKIGSIPLFLIRPTVWFLSLFPFVKLPVLESLRALGRLPEEGANLEQRYDFKSSSLSGLLSSLSRSQA